MRGYDNSTLGPKYPSVNLQETKQNDSSPEEVGGNALVQFGTELVLPMPFKGDWTRQVRPVLLLKAVRFLILNVILITLFMATKV